MADNERSDSLYDELTRDDIYGSLSNHFLMVGKGRRPTIPSIEVPTNKLLIQLFYVKEDGKESWDKMTSWFSCLFPDVPVTTGRLQYKIETLLALDRNSLDGETLNEVVSFFAIHKTLVTLGLSRDILLREDNLEISPVDISFNILSALERFRANERLSQAFVIRWASKLCAGYTDNQMRNRVTVALKKLKDANKRKENLETFLSGVAIPTLSEAVTDHQEPCNYKTCQCDCSLLRKQNRDLEEKLKAADEKEKIFKSEIELLKSERDGLKKLEIIESELILTKKKISVMDATIKLLHKSKLYKKNAKLNKDVSGLTALVQEKCNEIRETEQKLQQLDSLHDKLKLKLRSEQSLKSRYKVQKEKHKETIDSLQHLLQISDTKIEDLRGDRNNKFSPNVRMAVMQLQGEANVSASNCSKVIEIVSNTLFGMSFTANDLPSTSTSLNMADEAHHIAKFQIGDEIRKSQSFTYASDGTSRQKEHYMERHLQLNDGKVLSMGYTTIASDNAKSLLEQTIQVLDEISQIYSEEVDEDKDIVFKEILTKMESLMSDRAANMKLFNRKLADFKDSVLGEETSTHFLYCNAHFLLGLACAAEKAIKEEESKYGSLGRDQEVEFKRFRYANETATLRLIRTAAEIFGPSGDEKSGTRHEWNAFCSLKGIKSKFISHRTNRFNNIFQNACAVIFHLNHVKDFLANYCTINNLKTRSVTKDVEDHRILSMVASLGKMYEHFTSPYWKLMKSKTPYGSFPPFVQELEESLLRWHTSGPDNIFGSHLFQPFFHNEPSINDYEKSTDCDRSIYLDLFKILSATFCIVLQRQLADFLQGGKFFSLTPEVKAVLDICPLTNLRGEQLFGDLDFDMHKRRRASVHHRSSLVMWKHNKTSKWLSKKSDQDRKKIMTSAKKKGFRLKALHKEAENRVKMEVRQKLEDNKFKKQESDIKNREMKTVLLNQIISMGGICTTISELKHLFEKGKVEDLRVQLKYRKYFLGDKGVKVAGTKQELYSRLVAKIEDGHDDEDSDVDESDMEVDDCC